MKLIQAELVGQGLLYPGSVSTPWELGAEKMSILVRPDTFHKDPYLPPQISVIQSM